MIQKRKGKERERKMNYSVVYTLIMLCLVACYVDTQCPDCGLNGNCIQFGTTCK